MLLEDILSSGVVNFELGCRFLDSGCASAQIRNKSLSLFNRYEIIIPLLAHRVI